jgi:hypothetical protein
VLDQLLIDWYNWYQKQNDRRVISASHNTMLADYFRNMINRAQPTTEERHVLRRVDTDLTAINSNALEAQAELQRHRDRPTVLPQDFHTHETQWNGQPTGRFYCVTNHG